VVLRNAPCLPGMPAVASNVLLCAHADLAPMSYWYPHADLASASPLCMPCNAMQQGVESMFRLASFQYVVHAYKPHSTEPVEGSVTYADLQSFHESLRGWYEANYPPLKPFIPVFPKACRGWRFETRRWRPFSPFFCYCAGKDHTRCPACVSRQQKQPTVQRCTGAMGGAGAGERHGAARQTTSDSGIPQQCLSAPAHTRGTSDRHAFR
jgi:hypothetical protein